MIAPGRHAAGPGATRPAMLEGGVTEAVVVIGSASGGPSACRGASAGFLERMRSGLGIAGPGLRSGWNRSEACDAQLMRAASSTPFLNAWQNPRKSSHASRSASDQNAKEQIRYSAAEASFTAGTPCRQQPAERIGPAGRSKSAQALMHAGARWAGTCRWRVDARG